MRFFFSMLARIALIPLAVLTLSSCDESCRAQSLSLARPLRVIWRFRSEDLTGIPPLGSADAIFLSLKGGNVISLGASDGHLIWRTDAGGSISAIPTSDARGIYLASELTPPNIGTTEYTPTGAISFLSRASGITLWRNTLSRPIRGALTVNQSDVFAASADGKVYSFNKETGALLWSAQFPHYFSSQPVTRDKLLYLGTEEGYLLALDQRDGTINWRYRTRGAVRSPVVGADGAIYFGSSDGFVHALRGSNDKTIQIWRKRVGTGVQTLTACPEGLLVTTPDNFVVLIGYRDGKRLWKRQLPARLAVQPLLGGEGALFSPLGEEACIVLSLRDGKQVNTLPLGEDNTIVAAPMLAGNILLIPTREGLLAFAPSD